jgi:outer membrane protein OmpA-like peptidoglycan-associated protein
MKRLVLFLLLAVALAAAQQAQPQAPPTSAGPQTTSNLVERVDAPTYSDIYCAGFISKERLPESNFVAAGWDSPHQTRFSDRDYVYLAGGGLAEGAQLKIVRRLRDPNEREAFPGQRRMIRDLGNAYDEIGRVRVVAISGDIAISAVEFSCQAIVPGDVAVPWEEKPKVAFRRRTVFDRFAAPNGLLTGRIVLARDFDQILGTGQKVYLNVGANDNVKVGDYFRATRTYEQVRRDQSEAISLDADVAEDTQLRPPRMITRFDKDQMDKLPRRAMGEMVVLSVTPNTSTAMITYAIEPVYPGDGVEMLEPLPPPVAPAMNPPTLSCTANPPSVQMGERSTITCEAMSPDNRPVSISFAADRGRISADGPTAVLDTRDAGPGPITVAATAVDDRNLSANAMATVNVEAPAAPPAAERLTEIAFKRNSAYVDNLAKAVLDDVALRLQREPDTRLVIIGYGDTNERTPDRLPGLRAENAKRYLTESKGVDPARIETRAGSGGQRGEIWIVPAGAEMPMQPVPEQPQ